jgi:hypothetical protein
MTDQDIETNKNLNFEIISASFPRQMREKIVCSPLPPMADRIVPDRRLGLMHRTALGRAP